MRKQHDEVFLKILHESGLKSTSPRLAVLGVLLHAKLPLCIKDIHHRLTAAGIEIDLVTIYRTIEALREKAIVRRVPVAEDAAYYELFDTRRDKHHLTCLKCNKRSVVSKCFFSREHASDILNHAPQFAAVTQHSTEYFGICKKCAAKYLPEEPAPGY